MAAVKIFNSEQCVNQAQFRGTYQFSRVGLKWALRSSNQGKMAMIAFLDPQVPAESKVAGTPHLASAPLRS